MTPDTLFRFAALQMDRLCEDPRIQIAGMHLLFDMAGLSSTKVAKLNPAKSGKEMSKLFQEGYPIRVKSFIYYNEPTIVDFFMKLMSTWLKPKMKERIIRVKDNIGKACKKIHGLRGALPAEYGGDNASIDQIIAQFSPEFKKYISGRHLWDDMSVDESKRPEWAKHYLMEYADCPEQAMGTSGTYVQLPTKD
ncbi:unnamed protein product [Echinostoma caproni]|uniref:CRAL-TRIO domain-containing protein n=1 Tax=Echinostoma caproni TaxID=27848 RepID=A0A183B6W8_9TREM|nr:unnamed protein product [Echinostoma caproni]